MGQGIVAVEDVDIADTAPHVDVNIFTREVLSRVQGRPEGQRLAVSLAYVEGYSYREAATELDIPVGTVMSRLSTARRTNADGTQGARDAQ